MYNLLINHQLPLNAVIDDILIIVHVGEWFGLRNSSDDGVMTAMTGDRNAPAGCFFRLLSLNETYWLHLLCRLLRVVIAVVVVVAVPGRYKPVGFDDKKWRDILSNKACGIVLGIGHKIERV